MTVAAPGRAPGDPPAALGRTLRAVRPAAGRTALATLLGAGALAADIGLIGTAAWLISRAAQHPNEASLAVAIVAVQFFGLTRGLLRYGQRLVGHDGAFRLLAELRVQIYRQLERLAPAGLPAFHRGDLLARIVRDVDSMQDLVVRIVPAFGSSLLVGLATVLVMWWMLPAAGIILALALVLAATVVPALTGALARRREARFASARGQLATDVLDLTEGAAELVAFGATDAQLAAIARRDRELTSIAAASAGTAGIGLALTTLLAGLASWGCLLVGSSAVSTGRLDGTELAVITLIPLAAFELVVDLPGAAQALGRVRQAAGRLFELADAPTPVAEPHPAAPAPQPPYELRARSVWARYPGAHTAALRGVDLVLSPGRRVAVVGESGAGKSTLAAVLLRFLDCESGRVTLNGTPTEQLAGDDVRSVVGLVAQDAYLFDTTIAENLAVGDRDATGEQMRAVLDRVGLADWLAGLPRGLDTAVGDRGAHLSGGQRQRLGLARALLADFPVLILDEPAEHLDPPAADALTADLIQATTDRGLLLITHRLTGLNELDEIVVMHAGRVVERGRPDELLGRDGRYAQLCADEASAEHLNRTEQLNRTEHGNRRNDRSLMR